LASAPSSRRSTSSLFSASSVSFGSIEIRDYERIAGDHPETSLGVPLSIGWAFKQRRAVPLERYEQDKLKAYLEGNDVKRISRAHHGGTSANVKRLGAMTRKKMLHEEFGVPFDEIRRAERSVETFKKRLALERRAEEEGVPIEQLLPGKENKKKSIARSLRKGVMNKLSLRERGSTGKDLPSMMSMVSCPSPVQIVA
jgi:hypothetical protein